MELCWKNIYERVSIYSIAVHINIHGIVNCIVWKEQV